LLLGKFWVHHQLLLVVDTVLRSEDVLLR